MAKKDNAEHVFNVVASMITGGGEEPGLGENTDKDMSMTAATECYWGTSGRGNPNAKVNIRLTASLGFLKIEKRGRNERISVTNMGLKYYREYPTLVGDKK